jgi:PKD repeat protein
MPAKAYFDFDANGRTLTFTNLSTGATDWAWDFGDALTDNTQNPTHAYADDGIYLVKLTAVDNVGPSSDSFQIWLVVTAENRINLRIKDQVAFLSPPNLNTNIIQYSQLVKKWQMLVQPLVDPSYAVIAPADTFNELKWPSILNLLIAKLVIWDSIVDTARKAAMGGSGTNKGALKSIEQGPSKTSWYDNLAFIEALMKKDGFFTELNKEICMIGGTVGITLPMCPNVTFPTFIVGTKPKCNYYGFGVDNSSGLPGF